MILHQIARKRIACKNCGRLATVPVSSRRLVCPCQAKKRFPESYIGPGTFFANSVKAAKWWIELTSKQCDCSHIEHNMNKLGPDGCEREFDSLLHEIEGSAKKAGIPFIRSIASMLLRRAIKKSRETIS